ncbi:MAG: AmmeMemoRadiSam system protein B [Spirochaetales bacterium]|nr:AmmeMemoRadiSam system protein B [Spirochaetales bacterium]
MRPAVEGIMYPRDAKKALEPFVKALREGPASGCPEACSAPYVGIPHAAWQRCRTELDKAFGEAARRWSKAPQIFLLAPLHKGQVDFEQPLKVYAPQDGTLAGSDWSIKLGTPSKLLPYVDFSDDICSEEASLEIAAPYLASLFPEAQICYLLCEGSCEKARNIVEIVRRDFPMAPVFLSNNRETDCARSWKEAFGS